jgi:hypothetical protein
LLTISCRAYTNVVKQQAWNSQCLQGTLLDDGGSGIIMAISNRILPFMSPVFQYCSWIPFVEFEECPTGCDILYIYDGKDETAPLIGKYTGTHSRRRNHYILRQCHYHTPIHRPLPDLFRFWIKMVLFRFHPATTCLISSTKYQ